MERFGGWLIVVFALGIVFVVVLFAYEKVEESDVGDEAMVALDYYRRRADNVMRQRYSSGIDAAPIATVRLLKADIGRYREGVTFSLDVCIDSLREISVVFVAPDVYVSHPTDGGKLELLSLDSAGFLDLYRGLVLLLRRGGLGLVEEVCTEAILCGMETQIRGHNEE